MLAPPERSTRCKPTTTLRAADSLPRCAYPVALTESPELSQSLSGRLVFNQWLFIVFDGLLIAIATAAIVVFHPVFMLKEGKSDNVGNNFPDNSPHGSNAVDHRTHIEGSPSEPRIYDWKCFFTFPQELS